MGVLFSTRRKIRKRGRAAGSVDDDFLDNGRLTVSPLLDFACLQEEEKMSLGSA